MKRFISIILSVLLLLTLLPQTVIAESAYGTASFTEASGKRGKEVEIHLQMQCEKGLKTIALSDFAFDDSAITLVSGQWLLQGLLSDFNVEKKNAVFAFSSNTPVSGNILKLVFRISDSADAGEYPISCNITAKEKSTSQELPVDISLTPGKVTVEAPEHVHDFSILKSDDEYHWYECANGCSEISGKEKHSGGTATCTEKAKCSVCGTEYGNALGHSYTLLKSDGEYHWYECANNCGTISGKAAHTYGEWTVTKPATETEEGEKTHKCTVCDYEQKESIPVIVPTVCTAVFSSVTGKANDTVEVTLSVNCESGVKSMAVRDFQYDHDALTLVSGEWQGSAILKDFNAENGTGAFAFAENTPVNGAVLKLSFKISETAATGDYPVSCNVVAKQKADGAEKEITVTVTPGKVTVEAAPHVHDFSVLKSDETYHWYECANGCGTISGKAAHTYGEWTVTKPATETEEGEKERVCSVCGFKQTETIPKEQTSYEGPCAFAAVKDIQGDTVTVGIYLRDCRRFTSLDLTYSYDPSVMETAIDEYDNLEWDFGEDMNSFTPGEYTFACYSPISGQVNFSMYFDQPQSKEGLFELAVISFILKNGTPDTVTLNTHIESYASFDDTFEMPEKVVTVYNTETKQTTVTAPEDFALKLGDVNGDGIITAADARYALRASVEAEYYEPDSREFLACDVDGDGVITASDSRRILRAAVGLEAPNLFGTPDEEVLDQQGVLQLICYIDDDEYCVDLYGVNCIGLKSANIELFYDPDLLEYNFTDYGSDALEVNKTNNFLYFYDNETDFGHILFGFLFKNQLSTADEYAADPKDPDEPVNVNSEFFHIATFRFSIKDYNLSYMPEIQHYILSSSGIAPFKYDEVMLGDVDMDGKITASDARLALRRAVDIETYPEGSKEFIACDVDHDGKVTANDARSILRAAVDLEDPSTW